MPPWVKFLTNPSALSDYLGARLKHYREESNLTLSQMARICTEHVAKLKRRRVIPQTCPSKINRYRLGRIIRRRGVVKRIEPYEVATFVEMIPDLFDHILPPERPGAPTPPVPYRRFKRLEERLSDDTGLVFRVVKEQNLKAVASCAADVLSETIKGRLKKENRPLTIALTGGELQAELVEQFEFNPVQRCGLTPEVVPLNDVRWSDHGERSAEYVASRLKKKLGGNTFLGVATMPHERQRYAQALDAARIIVVGAGGTSTGFVAEFFEREKKYIRRPDDWVGDVAYFPINNEGNPVADVLQERIGFHLYGEPRFLRRKVEDDVTIILPLIGLHKVPVAKATIRAGLASHFIISQDIAEKLLDTQG